MTMGTVGLMDRKRPPIVADERTQLVGWYDLQRAIVVMKCEGGKNTDYDEGAASLRWMVLHLLEETARHAGHLDTIREILDGTKSYW
jgi:Protein of unknown function (DUF664)